MTSSDYTPPPNPGDTLKRVLVIKLGAMGDFMQALGAMRVVRATHPSARITLLTTEPFEAFAKACPYFDIVEADGRPKDLKGKADLIRADVLGTVNAGKTAAAKDITDRTRETPDTGKAVTKPVTPLAPAAPPPALAAPEAGRAVPEEAPAEQTDLRAGQCETDHAMADAEEKLGRKINPTIYSPAELAKRIKSDNAFVKRVLEQPKIWLIGGEDDLRA